MIYKVLNYEQFRDAFRLVRPDNFSYEGLTALYDYYDELGEDYELDVIAICCEWSEYTEQELIDQFGDTQEKLPIDSVIQYVNDNTYMIELPNGNYLVQDF